MTYQASCRYWTDYEYGAYRLLVAITCQVVGTHVPTIALVDTGSEWCVLPPDLVQPLGYDLGPNACTARLHSRFGLINGRVERVPIVLMADRGDDVEVPATCFLSQDWSGPAVLGWKGLLERIYSGFDPVEERFHFASLE